MHANISRGGQDCLPALLLALALGPAGFSQGGADLTSRAPKYNFGHTLAEQEAQLAVNPTLDRYRVSRRALANDPHRPLYHFVNPGGNLNDPNGLCFWQGRWHLFYQAFPVEDRRQHWGHAVSDDLIHWRDLPLAIYPDPEERVYSGATLVEADRVIAMYHGTKAGNMVAVSSDPLLLNWEKVTGRAVIPMPPGDAPAPRYLVFDPCIWQDGDMYYSLSGRTTLTGPGGRNLRAFFLFRSPDLAKWEYLHPFTENDHYGRVGDDGACPYFWPIGNQHILLHHSHTSGAKYILGDYDTSRQKFVVTGGGDFNFGAVRPGGVHAPSATPDDQGGVIVLFNMNPAKPTAGWNQLMTLPRRLTVSPDRPLNNLRIEPAGDIESLRHDHRRIGKTALPANEEVVLDTIRGNAMELIVRLDPMRASTLELNVLRSPRREEVTTIQFYPQRGNRRREWGVGHEHAEKQDSVLSIDTSASSSGSGVLSRPPETGSFHIATGDLLELRVFVDRSVVEVFANGRLCLAVRVYPERADSVGVSLHARGGEAIIESLDAWQMKSIYTEK